jgi:hypothetical protein
MKKTFTLLQASIIILMSTFISFKASAQAPTFFSGPSDGTTAPPASAAAVGKIVCAGGTISLSATTPNPTSTYVWRKKNSSNTFVVALGPGAAGANTSYSETPSAALSSAGYYTYTVEEINSNGCSTISNPITVFVLPPITPAIAGATPFCAGGQGSATLSVTGLVTTPNYAYNYQWSKNGTDISAAFGGTGATLPVTETTAGTYSFAVKVTFALSTGLTAPCAYTATQAMVVNPLPSTPVITIN